MLASRRAVLATRGAGADAAELVSRRIGANRLLGADTTVLEKQEGGSSSSAWWTSLLAPITN